MFPGLGHTFWLDSFFLFLTKYTTREENYRRGLAHFNIGIRNATEIKRGDFFFFPLHEAAEPPLCQLPLDIVFTLVEHKWCIQCPWSSGHWKHRVRSSRMSECATGTPATSIKYSIINFHPKRLSALQAGPQSELRL